MSFILSSTQRTVRPIFSRDLGVGEAFDFPDHDFSEQELLREFVEEAIELLEHDHLLVGGDLARSTWSSIHKGKCDGFCPEPSTRFRSSFTFRQTA